MDNQEQYNKLIFEIIFWFIIATLAIICLNNQHIDYLIALFVPIAIYFSIKLNMLHKEISKQQNELQSSIELLLKQQASTEEKS